MSAASSDRELTKKRLEVGIAIGRFRRQMNAERLGLYRRHLQVGVVMASPLVEAACRSAGVDVAAQMWRLRPPFGWPEDHRAKFLGSILDRLSDAPGMNGRWTRRAGASVVIPPLDSSHDPVTLRICAGAVELSTAIGDVYVRTDGGVARLRLPFRLPDQVANAVVGQPVGLLVGHPWFTAREWPIRGVVERRTGHELVVATGQVGFEMPWRVSVKAGGMKQPRAASRP